MIAWLTIPSARPLAECRETLSKWRRMGYGIALWLDLDAEQEKAALADYASIGPYPGYARAVNELCASVLMHDSECQWCVAGGDDTEPDLAHTADKIARECAWHFRDLWTSRLSEPPQSYSPISADRASTFGVMQPTGDRFAGGSIDRIAGSPWLGREWILRANGGRGPLWPEYSHMFVDEELFEVATRLGVYWARRDLIHLHRHFMRASDAINSDAVARPVPAHLVVANSPEHWQKAKALFVQRKAAGFPGSEPLA